ncbi:MAG: hypothetical protein JNL28_15030 [Planctomycetes bacterium]|nr:hypothetical protein [Planctomycetota bacterium]
MTEDDLDPPTTRLIEDSTSFFSFTNWAMALLTAAGAVALTLFLGWPLNLDTQDPEFNPAVFLVFFLCAVCLGYTFVALRDQLRGNKFGQSVLEMKGHHIAPGLALEGHVRSSRELRASGNYTLKFQCIETIVSRTSGKTYHENRVRWEAHSTVDAQDASLLEGIPVHFDIPERCRKFWSSPHANNISWTLEIRAPVEGLDYYASFDVPVWREVLTAEDEDEDEES